MAHSHPRTRSSHRIVSLGVRYRTNMSQLLTIPIPMLPAISPPSPILHSLGMIGVTRAQAHPAHAHAHAQTHAQTHSIYTSLLPPFTFPSSLFSLCQLSVFGSFVPTVPAHITSPLCTSLLITVLVVRGPVCRWRRAMCGVVF